MKFELSKKEEENLSNWLRKHLPDHGGKFPYAGAAGGSLSYVFTPTSLGTAVHVHCNHCESEENLTDFSHW